MSAYLKFAQRQIGIHIASYWSEIYDGKDIWLIPFHPNVFYMIGRIIWEPSRSKISRDEIPINPRDGT